MSSQSCSGGLGGGPDLHQAGVVDHDVEASQLRDGALHGGRHLVGVGDVGGHDQRCAAGGFDVGFQVGEPIGAAGEERHRGALCGQRFRRCRADAAAGAGHQGRGVCQCRRHVPPVGRDPATSDGDPARKISCRT